MTETPAAIPFQSPREQINDLRVALSSCVTLALDGSLSTKTMNAIAGAGQHALERDKARAAVSAKPRERYELIAYLCQLGMAEPPPAVETMVAACREASDELNRYRVWVDDLQSEMYVNCVYCGHRYGPNETTPVSVQDSLKAHVAVCPEHPMSGLLASLKEFQQHIVHDEDGDLTREEFSAMCARADAAVAKVQP